MGHGAWGMGAEEWNSKIHSRVSKTCRRISQDLRKNSLKPSLLRVLPYGKPLLYDTLRERVYVSFSNETLRERGSLRQAAPRLRFFIILRKSYIKDSFASIKDSLANIKDSSTILHTQCPMPQINDNPTFYAAVAKFPKPTQD